MGFLNFLKYNNVFPIAVSIVFLGAGGAFAATNPDAVYSSTQKVVSVDNTYIAGKNLSGYTPRVQIVGVTQDADFYYVAYTFLTIDLKDYVWKDVAKDEVMQVSKADLGPYRDLGLYVTEQLKQIVDREIDRLAQTQGIEKKNVTLKTVATAYGGLVGKFLDNTTEALPGYTPVVTPPPPPPPPPPEQVAAVVVAVPPPADPGPQSPPATSSPPASTPTSTPPVVVGLPPTMQILGDNPIQIPVGSTYVDLGASITGPTQSDLGLGIGVSLNGQAVTVVHIDTSQPGTWTIHYSASNAGGVTSMDRQVIVFEPPPPPPEVPVASTTPPIDPSATTTPEGSQPEPPAPDPTPIPDSPPPDPAPDPTPTPDPAPSQDPPPDEGGSTPTP